MKTIKIKTFSKEGDLYKVYLGNGTCNSFTSMRDVNFFLSSTNNFLTDKLHHIHNKYIDVWNAYQDNWFYFDNDKNTRKAYLYEADRNCSRLLNIVKKDLDLSVMRCGTTNGNYFVFQHFYDMVHCLEEIVRFLATLYGKHSNTNAICRMDILIRDLMYIRNELDNYGKKSTTTLFKVPTHLSEHKSYVPELAVLKVA